MDQKLRRHYLVSGRVQGVGFRNFVFRQASGLGLAGAVRNLEDGRVEILAEGGPAAITALETAIARGPVHANVTSVTKSDVAESRHPALNAAKTFAVEEDGERPWPAE